MPPRTFYVGRPTIFGNPFIGPRAVEAFRVWLEARDACAFTIVENMAREDRVCVDLVDFERYAAWDAEILLSRLPELRGLNLGCWCNPSAMCHADVLLELANK